MSDTIIPPVPPSMPAIPCAPPAQASAPARVMTHLDLPETDGSIVDNMAEHPQAGLLKQAMSWHLPRVFPGRQFCLGADNGIYWRTTDPPLQGCKAPDWFCVLDRPQVLDDSPYRRSYVLWVDVIPPVIVIEFVSGDGKEEHDTEPNTGKFWVYEQGICVEYYAILDCKRGTLEVYQLEDGHYRQMKPNDRSHYPIAPLRAELGLLREPYEGMTLPWLRWYDENGNLIPAYHELAQAEKQRADAEKQRADAEKQRADAEKQRATEVAKRAASAESRADAEKHRADKEASARRQIELRQQELLERLRQMGIDPEA